MIERSGSEARTGHISWGGAGLDSKLHLTKHRSVIYSIKQEMQESTVCILDGV